jgi:hypothetical protein
MAPQIKVLGGDFDTGPAWIYPNEGFVFHKEKKLQKPIPFDRAREFDMASEASLARLDLSRLLPDLHAAQANDPAKLDEHDFLLCFNDGPAVLIRVDNKSRNWLYENVERGVTLPARDRDDDWHDRDDEF